MMEDSTSKNADQFLERMIVLNRCFLRFVMQNLEEYPGADLVGFQIYYPLISQFFFSFKAYWHLFIFPMRNRKFIVYIFLLNILSTLSNLAFLLRFQFNLE